MRAPVRRAPGTGSVYRPSNKLPTVKRKKRRLYWLAYRTPAGPVWEKAKTSDRQDAETLLRTRLAALDRGEPPTNGRATWDDLAAMIRADYVANGRRSSMQLGQSLAHLERVFGSRRAAGITPDQVTPTWPHGWRAAPRAPPPTASSRR